MILQPVLCGRLLLNPVNGGGKVAVGARRIEADIEQ